MDDIQLLSVMVRGAYDIQMLRMQSGIRLAANFRAKLFNKPDDDSNPSGTSEPEAPSKPKKRSGPSGGRNPKATSEPASFSKPDDDSDSDEKEAQKILVMIRASYKNLTSGVARNRTLPAEKGFKGDELISTWAELALVSQFISLETEEGKQFRLLEKQLAHIPIYEQYLQQQVGIGPAMAGVLISRFNPHKARHASSFWKFAGLDVGSDGRGRSRRAEHLIERAYQDRNGDEKTRASLTYDPFVKTKVMGVLAGSFIRLGSPWRDVYDQYKHRLISDPGREKIDVNEWKRRHRAGDHVAHLWTPGRIDTAAKRYMVKMFLADFWVKWRTLEGLPVSEPYAVAKQGRRPHAA